MGMGLRDRHAARMLPLALWLFEADTSFCLAAEMQQNMKNDGE
jgi:hypothetical protein